MNAKLAKRLRKAARIATKNLPDQEYEVQEERQHKLVASVVNKFNTTRGLYLDLKREAKRLR